MKKFANESLPVWMQNHDWLFIYCCILAPVVFIIGIIVSLAEKQDEEYLLKKAAFFNKVGAPWFGRKEYLEYKDKVK